MKLEILFQIGPSTCQYLFIDAIENGVAGISDKTNASTPCSSVHKPFFIIIKQFYIDQCTIYTKRTRIIYANRYANNISPQKRNVKRRQIHFEPMFTQCDDGISFEGFTVRCQATNTNAKHSSRPIHHETKIRKFCERNDRTTVEPWTSEWLRERKRERETEKRIPKWKKNRKDHWLRMHCQLPCFIETYMRDDRAMQRKFDFTCSAIERNGFWIATTLQNDTNHNSTSSVLCWTFCRHLSKIENTIKYKIN